MTLIKCDECSGSISSSAKSCPHCGATLDNFQDLQKKAGVSNQADTSQKSSRAVWLLIVLAAFLAIVMLANGYGREGQREVVNENKQIENIGEELGSNSENESQSDSHPTASVESPIIIPYNEAEICKATIAAIMGRSYSIIRVDGVLGNIVLISYIRPQDNTLWEQRCKIEGNTIIWATREGRWRTHPLDSVIRFEINGSNLRIVEQHDDGSFGVDTFSRNGSTLKLVSNG